MLRLGTNVRSITPVFSVWREQNFWWYGVQGISTEGSKMIVGAIKTSDDSSGVPIFPPLTRYNKKNLRYERTEAVTSQITATLGWNAAQLRKRVDNRDFTSVHYVGPECLVFLIRHFRGLCDTEMVNVLARALVARCRGRIRKVLARIDDENARQDATDEVLTHLFREILDLESDKSDFFQVRFMFAIDRLTFKARKRAFASLNRTASTLRLSQLAGEDGDGEDEYAPFARSDAPELTNPRDQPDREIQVDDALKALEQMDPRCAEAWVLREVYGMQIEDQDPEVETISRHFGKTPRTIKNWLDKAEDALRRWRERNT